MAINLKSKKTYRINSPIGLSIVTLVIGIILSLSLAISPVADIAAETSYLSSKIFAETLADFTTYLKQSKVDGRNIYNQKYEKLNSMEYWIESNGISGTKVITNSGMEEYQLETAKKNSKFYLAVEFNSDTWNSEWNMKYGQFNGMIFHSALSRIIQQGSLGREAQSLGYDNIRMYLFIPNRTLKTGDFIETNINQYKRMAQFKFFIASFLVLAVIYMAMIIIGCYKDTLKGKGWEVLRKVNLEIKVLVAVWLYIKIRKLYFRMMYTGVLSNIISGTVSVQAKWLSFYIAGGLVMLCIMAWYMVEISYFIRRGIWQTIKEESSLYQNKALIKEKISCLLGKFYQVFGIDLRKGFYLKLVIINVLHMAALIVMALIAWDTKEGALLVGMIYGILWSILIIGIAVDFKHLKVQIQSLKRNEELQNIRFPYIKAFLGLVCYGLALIILSIIGYESTELGLLMALVISLVAAVCSFVWVKGYKKLYDYALAIRERRADLKPARSFLSPIIDELAIVDEGFQNAVNKEIVSQRMKTELISNVSHDLKTPLTSIINYVDLLKKEDLQEEKRQEYIKILEQKSQRLKVLIEDLFEASKTASGNVELVKEKIDLVALLKQTLGEMAEKISTSTLQFKVNMPEGKVLCELDGRRTYRIFENLVGNILKYAAPHSRVYIDCMVEEDITIIFRNISAYEMNFKAEEITERFKRGDESRHTEGSGLGLAIAKNLTELQGGKFEILVDGDLFKVILRFNKPL